MDSRAAPPFLAFSSLLRIECAGASLVDMPGWGWSVAVVCRWIAQPLARELLLLFPRLNVRLHIHVLGSCPGSVDAGSIQERILGPRFPRGTTSRHAGVFEAEFSSIIASRHGQRGILLGASACEPVILSMGKGRKGSGSIQQQA